jgi:LmbE family N-acetylglucosaminyl deacetylase
MRTISISALAAQPMRILCLGAHSDDIEIGCGATIIALLAASKAVEVQWVVFGATGARADEARQSAGMLLTGARKHEVTVLGFTDGFFPSEAAAIKKQFEELKGRFNPDLIFSHRGDDQHQDHRVISELTWNTFRNHLILEYEVPKYDGDLGQPNVFVPADSTARARKIEILTTVFGTQRDKRWFSPETFDGLMRIRGVECASPTGYAQDSYARKITLNRRGNTHGLLR